MELHPSRLRRGELIAAVSAVVLLVLLFAVPWFGSPAGGHHPAATGWSALPVVRWLILVTAAMGVVLAFVQASWEAPALPVTISMLVMTLGALTTVVLIVRLPTAAGTPQAGAFLGLLGAVALTLGGYYSFRDEDGWQPGPDHPIERVSLTAGKPS